MGFLVFRDSGYTRRVVMPGMSGVEMAVLVKQRHPDCKVLLFSGQASTLEMLETARSQGHDFELLAKPVHPSDLLAKSNATVSRPTREAEEAGMSQQIPTEPHSWLQLSTK